MLTTGLSLAGAYAARRAYQAWKRVPVKDDVALVTGSAGGLGFQLCVELIARGVSGVVVLDLDQAAVDAAVERLQLEATERRQTCTVRGYACNVADAAAVKAMAAKVEGDVGAVDILINNAGIVSGKPFLQLTEEQIRRTFAVNTLAHFWMLVSVERAVIGVLSFHRLLESVFASDGQAQQGRGGDHLQRGRHRGHQRPGRLLGLQVCSVRRLIGVVGRFLTFVAGMDWTRACGLICAKPIARCTRCA
jgi:NAD(P)-dependent dehydrogenase (short-subunit alcohol dehydrogenase family)